MTRLKQRGLTLANAVSLLGCESRRADFLKFHETVSERVKAKTGQEPDILRTAHLVIRHGMKTRTVAFHLRRRLPETDQNVKK